MRSFSQDKIMDMQCDLLISDFRNPTTTALMQENIGHISDGSSPHCAGALNLGFEKAFELKKRGGYALLRCSNSNCGWHKNPVPCSSVGSKTYCSNCTVYSGYVHSRPPIQCADCGYHRAGDYASCQNCRKRFR